MRIGEGRHFALKNARDGDERNQQRRNGDNEQPPSRRPRRDILGSLRNGAFTLC
jgi:hypothetical protein